MYETPVDTEMERVLGLQVMEAQPMNEGDAGSLISFCCDGCSFVSFWCE